MINYLRMEILSSRERDTDVSTKHDLSYFSEALVGFGVLCNIMKTGKVIKTFSYYKDEYLHVL